MRDAVRRRLPDLQAGFWFVPILVALIGPALMIVVYTVDRSSGDGGLFPTLFISPTSAQLILSTIAGSLVTVAGLTSSLTIVTLQLLSSQYTPRALRGFLRGRLSQVVFGALVGIFAYCLLLLITVRNRADYNAPFVPSLGVVAAIGLALLGLILLIVFIHHMVQTIQVPTMAAGITGQTLRVLDRLHARQRGFSTPLLARPSQRPTLIFPERSGYVRQIAFGGRFEIPGIAPYLLSPVRPGDFVTPSTPIAAVWTTGGGPVPARALARRVEISPERDLQDDPDFGLRQLADIALRAISPGINDPTTAVTCIGHLGAIIERLAQWQWPAEFSFRSATGTVIGAARTFDEYAEVLVEISRYAVTDPRVTGALLDAVARAATAARAAGTDAPAVVLAAIAREIAAPAIASARNDEDRCRLEAVQIRVTRALGIIQDS